MFAILLLKYEGWNFNSGKTAVETHVTEPNNVAYTTR
jgi:hypothetical protein